MASSIRLQNTGLGDPQFLQGLKQWLLDLHLWANRSMNLKETKTQSPTRECA